MVDLDNTIADYTNGLRDYIRECGCGEEDYPCPEPTAYDFTLTVGWPFNGDPKAFTWWHTRAVADGLYSKEEPYEGAVAIMIFQPASCSWFNASTAPSYGSSFE